MAWLQTLRDLQLSVVTCLAVSSKDMIRAYVARHLRVFQQASGHVLRAGLARDAIPGASSSAAAQRPDGG